MYDSDSANLLRECNSGSKMAVSSIRNVMDDVKEEKLKQILKTYIKRHEEYGEEIHAQLSSAGVATEEPATPAKAMAKVVTEVKLLVDHSNGQIAEVMIDGGNMGVKSISKFQNRYAKADPQSKKAAEKLIQMEQQMADDLRQFLS